MSLISGTTAVRYGCLLHTIECRLQARELLFVVVSLSAAERGETKTQRLVFFVQPVKENVSRIFLYGLHCHIQPR
jgi:hypothetical protein